MPLLRRKEKPRTRDLRLGKAAAGATVSVEQNMDAVGQRRLTPQNLSISYQHTSSSFSYSCIIEKHDIIGEDS